MKSCILIPILLLSSLIAQAQLQQTIKGYIRDKDLQFPLTGATVTLYKADSLIAGCKSDDDGFFKLENIQTGRYSITCTYIGYEPRKIHNIEVNSGKEFQTVIEMDPKTGNLKEVVIHTDKFELNNEMAGVSARTFNPEEASRYTASREDIARMATNFAGVRGGDDSRNDIVIRGNTPNGIIWRIEDMDVPNPNHFASFGSTGGPVNVINNKLLGNSDFITSAFPADYGNGISGVFDLKLRNGNKEKHEFTAQLGLLGIEATAEGPISKKNASSYTFSYRYSTLAIMNKLGINFGTGGEPSYQDVNLKLHLPLNKTMQINVFALGGKSDIAILDNGDDSTKWTFGRTNRDIHFGSRFGLFGINFQHILSRNSFHKLTIGYNLNEQYSQYDTIANDRITRGATYRNNFDMNKLMLHYYMSKRFSEMFTMKTGLYLTLFTYNMVDSNYYSDQGIWYNEAEFRGSTQLLQAYTTWKYHPNEDVNITAGLHYMRFLLNGSQSLEPRLGLNYKISNRLQWNTGYGLHSNLQTMFIYFLQKNDIGGYPYLYNINTGFNKSHHVVSGLDYKINEKMRAKVELYYQYLFNIPQEIKGSAYVPLNQGASFNFVFPDELENKAIGSNYGIDLTLERIFMNSYYYLITGSLYSSRYRTKDNIWRNTDFNAGYNLNLLAGKEWKVGKRKNVALIGGFKFNLAGGKWYTPIDLVLSQQKNQYEGIDHLTNTLQFKPYHRLDIRMGFKWNRPRVFHHFYIDVINAYNRKNPLGLSYDARQNKVIEEYQLGLLPLFNWLVEF